MAGKWLEAIYMFAKVYPFQCPILYIFAAFMRLGVSLPQLSNIKECVSQCKGC